jgi:hypothetical protein
MTGESLIEKNVGGWGKPRETSIEISLPRPRFEPGTSQIKFWTIADLTSLLQLIISYWFQENDLSCL